MNAVRPSGCRFAGSLRFRRIGCHCDSRSSAKRFHETDEMTREPRCPKADGHSRRHVRLSLRSLIRVEPAHTIPGEKRGDGRSSSQRAHFLALNRICVPSFPATIRDLEQVEPVYETHPGWLADTSRCRDYGQLPENARRYLDRLSELVETEISVISVGPDRAATIVLEDRPQLRKILLDG